MLTVKIKIHTQNSLASKKKKRLLGVELFNTEMEQSDKGLCSEACGFLRFV